MVTDTDEKVVSLVNDGKLAQLAYVHFKAVIDKTKGDILSKVMGEYRSGKNDHFAMASQIGALCALDDLDRTILKAIHRGDKLEKELFNHATQ